MKQLCFAVTRLASHNGTHMTGPNESSENSVTDGLTGTMKNLLQSFNSFSTTDTTAGTAGILSSGGDACNSASLHTTFQALQLARVNDGCTEDESCRKEILTHHSYKDNVHFYSATNLHSTRGEDGRQNNTSPVHYSDPGSETSRAATSQSVKPKLPLRRLSFQAHPPLTQDSCSFYYKENSASEQTTEMFRYIQELSSQFEARAAQQQQRIEELQQMVVSVEKINSDLVSKVKELEVQVDKEKEGRFYNGDFYWKIQEFSQYQLKAVAGEPTMLHSPPFYTSAWGYKLCVRANITSQHPPFLSLFVHFMQGQNDHILSWPFSGKIVLTIVDQNPDVNSRMHISETLTAKPHLAAFQRPTTIRNHKGFGYVEFIQLPSLRNKYYTVDDTIIIRAQVFSDQ